MPDEPDEDRMTGYVIKDVEQDRVVHIVDDEKKAKARAKALNERFQTNAYRVEPYVPKH